MIKSDPELNLWVNTNSLVKSDNFAEMIYSALSQETNECHNGQVKKFNGISEGYIGCGPAGSCKCTAEKVSKSVKISKSNTTEIQKQASNNKRARTNLEKYGVANAAQTVENRQKFRDWYANPENVNRNLERIKATNLERYGVENCKSLPEVEQKIIATCLARYGVTNVAQIPSTKAKLRARTAEYKLTGHLLSQGYYRFTKYVQDNYNFTVMTTAADYKGASSGELMQFQCNHCGNRKTVKFHYNRGLNCEVCHPVAPQFTSKEEQSVFDYVSKELGIIGTQGDRSLISPYELDMVFPDHAIAIEYSGLYWHSESSSGKGKGYHYEKMLRANQSGYRLVTIFSDEWINTPEIVKSKLRNIFKKTDKRHYARKLEVKIVSSEDSKVFLNLHHLQGNSSAKINIGLYNGHTLVALMTFSNGRAALNTKVVEGEYELVRFVTNGDSVVGGASKLLAHFTKTYKPTRIVSYADLRWSEGNVYSVIGFKKVGTPTIGYWYVDSYQTRMHRYNFTKTQLVKEGNDARKTEWEIMQDLGYDRIWDCGHQKYILNCDILKY